MTSIAITFEQLPEPGDYVNVKARSKVPPYNIVSHTEVFKVSRIFAGECEVKDTLNDQAQAYCDAFSADYSGFLVLIPDANQVIISLAAFSMYSEITEVEMSGGFTGGVDPLEDVYNTIHIIRFTPKRYKRLPVMNRYLVTEDGKPVITENENKIKL